MFGTKKAIFAAGCFWGVEELFRQLPGVVETTVGYIGGTTENPTYEEVCSHTTGHAEAVEVEYDPEKITYEDLLKVFWKGHNPTSLNRQGADVGPQYRSAIFYLDDDQRKIAEASKEALIARREYAEPIKTEITEAGPFYPAEEYHQKYFLKNGGPSCHI
jgi:peptide-methionine (S)-S-oxide reductase